MFHGVFFAFIVVYQKANEGLAMYVFETLLLTWCDSTSNKSIQ